MGYKDVWTTSVEMRFSGPPAKVAEISVRDLKKNVILYTEIICQSFIHNRFV